MRIYGKSFLLCAFLSPFLVQEAVTQSMPQMSGMQGTPEQVGAAPEVAHAETVAPQQISPARIVVHILDTQRFVSAGATKWTATAGSISSAGVYVAPPKMPASDVVKVTATGPGGTATAIVTLVSGPAQPLAPAKVTLALSAKQQFVSEGATLWSALYGSISSTGLYTAPKYWPPDGTDNITASGPRGSAFATVTFLPPQPKVTAAGLNGEIPQGLFFISVSGTGLTSASVVRIHDVVFSSTCYNGQLTVTGFASVPGPTTLTVTNANLVSNVFPVRIGVPNPLASQAAAHRFLEQAAFGPSPSEVQLVQALGIEGWIQEQSKMGQVSTYTGVKTTYGGMPEMFLTNAVMNPDQLRQRVAFALSQIFVTSLEKLGSNQNMISYQDMLLSQAFTNYRQIMEAVTISPAMGQYLDMANNAKANPSTGSEANQNFARELMQLFTIGTNMLNQDGSMQLDANGLPIPTYTQFQISEFARVYTGFTYAPKPGSSVAWDESVNGGYGTLVPYPPQHDFGSKQLLLNHVAPAGLSPTDDLEQALDNIFSHPNVAPFVCTQLIQHLVKSNPSRAYIARVSKVFNNNGHNVRGDMKSVINAILMDPEARANDEGGDQQASDGHLQEPALFIAAMVRAFGGTMTPDNYYHYDLASMGQDIFDPPSVFNYYAPNTGVPGTNLMGGEFQIYTPNNAILRANEVSNLFSQWNKNVQTYGPGTSVDISAFIPYGPVPIQLVDALDLTLTHGTMPAAMKSAIVAAVAGETGGSLRRVQRACYLILTSSYYNAWH